MPATSTILMRQRKPGEMGGSTRATRLLSMARELLLHRSPQRLYSSSRRKHLKLRGRGLINEHPDVLQSAAIAVKSSAEPGANEEIKAVVVKSADSSLSEEDLIQWLIPRLPRFIIPRYIEFADGLPRTPTMKVRKSE